MFSISLVGCCQVSPWSRAFFSYAKVPLNVLECKASLGQHGITIHVISSFYQLYMPVYWMCYFLSPPPSIFGLKKLNTWCKNTSEMQPLTSSVIVRTIKVFLLVLCSFLFFLMPHFLKLCEYNSISNILSSEISFWLFWDWKKSEELRSLNPNYDFLKIYLMK